MKKILFTLILTAALCAFCTVPGFAVTETTTTVDETVDTARPAPETDLPIDTETPENEEAPTDTETETPLISGTILGFLDENTAEILGTLTFIASLLVAFLYKKGILPLLRSGLTALSESAGKTGKLTESFTIKAEEEIAAIRECTMPVAEILSKTEECMEEMKETIAAAQKAQEQTRRILATETTLFYELLASANLPQAQKDSMTESYYRLRDELEEKP